MFTVIETAQDGREVWRTPCATRESAEEYVQEYGRLAAVLFDVAPTDDEGLIVTSTTLGDTFRVTIIQEEN